MYLSRPYDKHKDRQEKYHLELFLTKQTVILNIDF